MAVQNFLICIEMLFASILLRYAFPSSVYSSGYEGGLAGRPSFHLQRVTSNLKDVSVACVMNVEVLIYYLLFEEESKRRCMPYPSLVLIVFSLLLMTMIA